MRTRSRGPWHASSTQAALSLHGASRLLVDEPCTLTLLTTAPQPMLHRFHTQTAASMLEHTMLPKRVRCERRH